MVGGVRITSRPFTSRLILSALLCGLWEHGHWHHTDGVIVHILPYICSVTLGNVLIFVNKKKWYCYDVMEINYFDLPGDFTLNFFFPLVGNNWSLILKPCPGQKKKKKKHFIFSATKMGSGMDSIYRQNQQMTYVGLLIELWGKKL